MVRCCGEEVDESTCRIGTLGCFGVLFLTSVILFAVSFGTLEPLEAGIKYNNNLVSIEEDRVYNNGRYFLGLGLWFVKFPVHTQYIEFLGRNAVSAWSREKQSLQIEVSIGYRLQRNKIVDIYRRYGEDGIGSALSAISIAVMKNIAIRYETIEFFTKRATIAEQMKQAVRQRFKEEFASVEIFNLRDISIPANFEDKIVTKVVKAQERRTQEEIRQTRILQAAIDVIRATGDATINQTLATAEAHRQQVVQNAVSLGQLRLRQQEAVSYQELKNELGIAGESVLKYRWAQMMSKLEESDAARQLSFLIGFKSPTIQVQQT